MKFLILLFACAALASGATTRSEHKDKRLIGLVGNLLDNVRHHIENDLQTAGQAVAGAVATAGQIIGGVAHNIVEDIHGVVHTVSDDVLNALANQARIILTPFLNQVAGTVGPIAENLLTTAVNKLVEQAPEILTTLGRTGVEQLVSRLFSGGSGKRDVSGLEYLKTVFGDIVQQEVDKTVNDVHRAAALVEKFNADLKKEVDKLELALQTAGVDAEIAVRHFFSNVVTAVQPLIDGKVFDLDLDCFDSIIPNSIQRLEDELRAALHRNAHKRFIFADLVGGVLGILHQGEQHLASLINSVANLAHGLLTPTLENVRHVAETLLNNVGSVSIELVNKVLGLLTPYRQQLGPLYQQVQILAINMTHNQATNIGQNEGSNTGHNEGDYMGLGD